MVRTAPTILKATEPVLPLTEEAGVIQPMPIDAPVRLPLTPNQIVSWTRSDIRTLPVDAIINAANEQLLGGGGLDGAIHAAAGPALLAACKLLNGCETGEVKITPGFDLPARFIIHAVGPRGNQSGTLLSFCYLRALDLAVSKGLRSVVFPCLSTGIFGFDKAAAADIALGAVSSWLRHRGSTSSIISIVFAINQDNDESWSNFPRA